MYSYYFLFVFIFLFSSFTPFSVFSQSEPSSVASSPNYYVKYIVTVDKKDPLHPSVDMVLQGADEILSITSIITDSRYRFFRGTGEIQQVGSDIIWKPNGLHGTLSYQASILHEKSGMFDSYGKRDWVITRTADLFPYKRFLFRKQARSYTVVEFRLPQGWDVETEMPRLGPFLFLGAPFDDVRYTAPTGWLIYGKIENKKIKSRDAEITIAYPSSFVRATRSKDPERKERRQRYLDWFSKKIENASTIYERVLPLMEDFMPKYARRFLVVMGKDPMWKGGLSGESSLFINRGVPNIVSDFTSTLVHEYFHVCDGFEKNGRDGEWIVEGLAEYYSIRLLYEAKIISKKEFLAGLTKIRGLARAGVDVSRSHRQEALYKNAPLIFYTLDEIIRRSNKKQSLNNVVTFLAEVKGPVGTSEFKKICEEVVGESLDAFFKKYVYQGQLPAVPFVPTYPDKVF